MVMDIVERLSERFTDLDDHLRDVIDDARKEIETMRTALQFYANRKHYDLFVRAHSSMGEYETSFIQDDCGSMARAALKEEK